MNYETLNREHIRQKFDCGDPRVNDFLAKKAFQHQKKGVCTTQVLTSLDSNEVVAFYTLAPISIGSDAMPPGSTNYPYNKIPVILIGWMGVDISLQGQGNGQIVLLEALDHALAVMKGFAGVGVVLDAISTEALDWYLKQEIFTQLPGHSNRLFVSRKTLEKAKSEGKL